MKNDGFSLFSRLPSFGWEVLHPPPKVMCEDMHNQYLRSRAQLGGWPNSLGTRENSIMVRHHGRASSARSRKVSCGHGYLPRAGKRVAAAQRKGPDFLNHIRGSSHDKCQEQTFEGVNRTFFDWPKTPRNSCPREAKRWGPLSSTRRIRARFRRWGRPRVTRPRRPIGRTTPSADG